MKIYKAILSFSRNEIEDERGSGSVDPSSDGPAIQTDGLVGRSTSDLAGQSTSFLHGLVTPLRPLIVRPILHILISFNHILPKIIFVLLSLQIKISKSNGSPCKVVVLEIPKGPSSYNSQAKLKYYLENLPSLTIMYIEPLDSKRNFQG